MVRFSVLVLVFVGNAVDVMLTDDRDDNSSLDLLTLLAIKLYPNMRSH